MAIPGQIILTFEVLAKALGLNEEHKVVAVVPQTAQDIANGRFSVLIDGPAFNQLAPRHAPPQAILWKGDADVANSWELQRMKAPHWCRVHGDGAGGAVTALPDEFCTCPK